MISSLRMVGCAFKFELILVLYSPASMLWKVTDFGLTMKGTTKHSITTKYARGTSSYRAPELIQNWHFNNKVDIFAVGCIYYELFSNGVKAFKYDHDVVMFYSRPDAKVDIPYEMQTVLGQTGRILLERILKLELQERPNAESLCLEFASNRWISFGVECDRLGNESLTVEAYRTATDLSVVHCTVWKALGDAYGKADAHRQALEAYRRAVESGYEDRTLMMDIERTVDALQHNRLYADDQPEGRENENRRVFQHFAERWLHNRGPRNLPVGSFVYLFVSVLCLIWLVKLV